MLEFVQVVPEWSVLLAVGDPECARLLGIILDGFGYKTLECQLVDDARRHLSQIVPIVAVVDLALRDAKEICGAVKESGGVPLLVLVAAEEEEPEALCQQLQADAWEKLDAEPEKFLSALRRLAENTST